MTMLFVMGIVMVFLAIALLGMAIAKPQPQGINRSLAVLEAMSSAPSELTADLNRPFSERVLDPLMGKATGLGKRLTGADTAERIRRKLDTAGNPGRLTVDKIIAGKVIGAVVGLIAAGAVTALLGTSTTTRIVILAAGVAVGFLAPNLYLYQVSYDRSGKMQRELPDAIDLMTISVESGLGFDAALQQVASQHHRPALRRVRSRPAGDADRPEPLRRAALARGPGQRPRGPLVRQRDGAGRLLRHPDRPGAARAVGGDPRQAPPAGRGEGAAGAR